MLTLDEAIKHLEETLNNPYHEWSCAECKAEHEQLLAWLKELKEFREMPKGDLISRSALKKEIIELDLDNTSHWSVIYKIDNAPTVEPCYQTTSCLDCGNYDKENHNCPRYCEVIKEAINSRPQGEWIRKVDEVGFISHICSKCGAEIEVEDCSDDKFCFNCGAKMKGGAE